MSGSRTIIDDDDRLDNIHPGDILREDFLVGSEIPIAEVVQGSGLGEQRLYAILQAEENIDADADLRLTRYFGMSEGFFLSLQNDFDLEEVRRNSGQELDRIVRRAA
jgi:addiction module HigA family antidote